MKKIIVWGLLFFSTGAFAQWEAVKVYPNMGSAVDNIDLFDLVTLGVGNINNISYSFDCLDTVEEIDIMERIIIDFTFTDESTLNYAYQKDGQVIYTEVDVLSGLENEISSFEYDKPLIFVKSDGNKVIIGGFSNAVFLSDDFGYSWIRVDLPETLLVQDVEWDGESQLMFTTAFFGMGGFSSSEDLGETWTSTSFENAVYDVEQDSSENIFLGCSQGRLLVSSNLGMTWDTVSLPDEEMQVRFVKVRPDRIEAFGGKQSTSLFYVVNQESIELELESSSGIITSYDELGPHFRAAGTSDGVVLFDKNISDIENISTYAQLFYPNPTISSISIHDYEVVQTAKIFNSQGRLLLEKHINDETLDLSMLPQGNYLIVFIDHEGGFTTERLIKI